MPFSQTIRLTRKLILHVHTQDAYNPNEARKGKGPGGGQFTKGGGGSGAGGSSRPSTSPRGSQQTGAQQQTKRPTREMLMGDLARYVPRLQPDNQDVKDLDDLYNRAKRDEPDFVQSLNEVAHAVGGEAHFTPPQFAEPGTTLKSRKSAERKLKNDLNNDPTQLKDVMRGTVVSDKIETVRAAAAKFIEQYKDNIVRVKDRIIKPAPGGYRDILINYRTPGGLIAEVQFNTPVMINEKDSGEGHKIYEKIRDYDARPNLTPEEAKQREELLRRSEEVYGRAYQEGGNGNWAGKA